MIFIGDSLKIHLASVGFRRKAIGLNSIVLVYDDCKRVLWKPLVVLRSKKMETRTVLR